MTAPEYTAADVARADQAHADGLADLVRWLPAIRAVYDKHGAIPAVAAIDEMLRRQNATARKLRVAFALAMIELAKALPEAGNG